MSEEKPKGKMPDYTGEAEFIKDGINMKVHVAAWVNKDKNDKTYLGLSFGGVQANLFKFEPKPRKEDKPTQDL